MSGDALSGFVDELAGDPPGPASGSAAAVTVATAAALAELAARRAAEQLIEINAGDARA